MMILNRIRNFVEMVYNVSCMFKEASDETSIDKQ